MIERNAPGRRAGHLPRGHLRVLLAKGRDHVASGHVARGELLRVHPDAYAVVALAQHGHVADTRQTRQLVLDLQRRVIAQVKLVITLARQVDRDGKSERPTRIGTSASARTRFA